jgi:hypothetical protein
LEAQESLAAIPVIGMLVWGDGLYHQDTQKLMESVTPTRRYAKVAAWLEQMPPAESAFSRLIGMISPLFFYSPQYDRSRSTYMQLYNADLYDQWTEITRGNVKRPSSSIQTLFDTRYVVSDLNHQDFIAQAEADPSMELVYRDHEAIVFRIKD